MLIHRWTLPAVLAVSVNLLAAVSLPAEVLHRSVLLMGFERAAGVAEIHVRRSTHLEIVDGDAPGGLRAAKVTYEAVEPRGEQWPAIILQQHSLAVKDFTPFAAISFWVRNLGMTDAELQLTMWDRQGKRSFPSPNRFVIKPGAWQQLVSTLSLEEVDGANIASVHFYQNANRERFVLMFDEVRLLSTFAAQEVAAHGHNHF